MGDRPILFSVPMVRALLDGRKTQTRRILKPQPFGDVIHYGWSKDGGAFWTDQNFESRRLRIWAGDRLWVRETWTARMTHGWTIADARSRMYQEEIFYAADGDESIDGWWPSIHMPREFSRLTLTVTDVRVQRLQDISEDDARAEGVQSTVFWRDEHPASICFSVLWNSINGPESWHANPWVAAYTFTVEHRNIDACEPSPAFARTLADAPNSTQEPSR